MCMPKLSEIAALRRGGADPRTARTAQDVAAEAPQCANCCCHSAEATRATCCTAIAKHCQLHKTAPSAKRQRTCYAAFLFIFLCVILLRSGSAAPTPRSSTTASGQRLILHTTQHRQRYHQQLLRQQRAQIETTTPHHLHHMHHRALDDNNKNNMEEPNRLVDVVVHALTLANTTVDEIHSFAESFIPKHFNKSMDEMSLQWSQRTLALDHPVTMSLNTDLEEHHNCETLYVEISKVSLTLKMFDDVILDILKRQEDDKARHVHDHGEARYHNSIDFYKYLLNYVKENMNTAGVLLARLNVAPLSPTAALSYDTDAPEMEWMVWKEYYAVMKYLQRLYNTLQNNCPSMPQ